MISSSDVVFDSDDLSATEDFLVRNYTKMTIGGDHDQRFSTRIARKTLGEISIDEVAFHYDISYDSEPLGTVCLCRVREGHIEDQIFGEPPDVYGPGDVALIAPPELPYSGRVHAATYDLTVFDTALLSSVASPESGDGEPVRLLGHRPVSTQASRQLNAVIDFFRETVHTGHRMPDLVASTAATFLASVVVSTMPTNAMLEPDGTDRADARPVLLRKAISYIEGNAQTGITVTDIAAAVHVTPRALQYMFRRYLDTSPMAYLRRVRLDHAHRELAEADPTADTVNAVAHRWGFFHTGRFSALYRQTYGCTPSATLRK